ncbi:MAG: outer membrane beta-barrel protein [Bacteroidales bacterium]|nr:outer membrane beta-barrel protein [Bacteroidales bacterium]
MKKILFILISAALTLSAAAQPKATVKLALIDTLTGEAASYAAVVLYPENDTTAMHYALAGLDGKAQFEKISYGKYILKAELMGYETLKRNVNVNKSNVNLGTMAMKEDFQMLEGATISAVGNAITIRQDTIEYTASSFKVKDNAVLIDLLRKLPGIEIGSDGSITSGGETIKKITLNGKTFFLDDPSLATENIPVSVIEKVKVIDKKSEQAQFSGIEDDDTEKIIDVSTYKGMFNGWFGNLSGGLGRDLRSASSSDSKFTMSNDWRYQGNGIIGRFNETDQLAFVANGNNTNTRGGFGPGGGFGAMKGINDEWMAGVNYGSTRVKDLEANISAEYGQRKSDVQSKDEKTTYVNDGDDLLTSSDSKSKSGTRFVEVGGEISYEPEGTRIFFRPRINMEWSTSDRSSSSATGTEDESDIFSKLNDSRSFSYGITQSKTADGRFMIGKRILKPGRTLSLSGRYSFSGSQSDAKEFSRTDYLTNGTTTLIDQYSHTDTKSMSLTGNLEYTEPLSDNWFVSARYSASYSHSNSVKNTFDWLGAEHSPDDTDFIRDMDNNGYSEEANVYYSSSVENIFVNHQAGVMMQFQKDRNFIQFGATLQPTYNETHTTKFGVTTDMGEGEWLLNWSPEVRARYNFNQTTNLRANYNGRSQQPSTARMQPILDVSNPTAVTMGNAYLLPSFTHNARLFFNTNNKYTFSSLTTGLFFNYGLNSVVTASWFDKDGVSYSIPVNAKKPSQSYNAFITYNTPISRSSFSIASNTRASLTNAVSYQNVSSREGLDATTFEYDSFMKDFWGTAPDGSVDASGSSFYSGASGFAESRTTAYSILEDLSLRYNGDKLYASLGGTIRYNNAIYSLNSAADKHTLDNSIMGSLVWTLWDRLELSSDATYTFYRGYTAGYNDPEFIWNAGVSYKLGSVSLAVNAYDLLEQSKSISRTTTENYLLDSWSNRLGRYIMFKLTWTFGKFNNDREGRGGFGGGRGGFGGNRGGFGGPGGGGRF